MAPVNSYNVENPDYRNALEQFAANPQVMIEITSICNFACTYCVSSHNTRKKVTMGPELFQHIARQLPSLTTKPVRLHIDGEPTSHPAFIEYVREVNAQGLPVALATNGSLLKPEYVGLWMDLLVSMSTNPEELAIRHRKLQFEKYIDTCAAYAAAWARADSKQSLNFQIIYNYWVNNPEYPEYNARKNAFLSEFIERTGIGEYCEPLNSIESTAHRLKKKRGRGVVAFVKQLVTRGGAYPVDGKMVDGDRTDEGFCDSPWKRLTIQSDGTISCCCVDLTGGTAYTDPSEIWKVPLADLWKKHAGIQALRSEFVSGKVEREVCKTCLGSTPSHAHYIAPIVFPLPAQTVSV